MTISSITRTTALLALAASLALTPACRAKKKPSAVGKDGAPTELGEGNFPTGSGGRTIAGEDPNGGAPASGEWGDGYDANGNKIGGSAKDPATGGAIERMGGDLAQEGKSIPELGNIFFEFDSDDLTPAGKAQLDKNAAYLKSNAKLNVVLRGHTDDRGTEEYNMSLGQNRASAVREYLISQGVGADRMETISFGKTLPATEASDDASRSKNRRVEFFAYTLDK